ncbi:hypothetical protein BJY18_003215 [Amycolatopsis jiangsuensis]|uniref:Uncharacterized protein n=1 Tax=Amycolatopsis jiangsuensis TaxID=1181879 RepID=A0A840IV30_9PSEU|nr:hypothetical protein [Amycolatopsis jiangsuensis]
MSAMWQGCLADTDYFEMRSSGGSEYGIWVTMRFPRFHGELQAMVR